MPSKSDLGISVENRVMGLRKGYGSAGTTSGF